MNKKWRANILISVGLMLWVPASQAILVDNMDGTVTDDSGLMWLQSPDDTDMTWMAAVKWAADLVFAGFDDWRLPSAAVFPGTESERDINGVNTEPNLVNNEFGFLYGTELLGAPRENNPESQAPLEGYDALRYWTGTRASETVAYVFMWTLESDWQLQTFDDLGDEWHVTAVRDASMSPDCPHGSSSGCSQSIPEPASIALLLLGIAGLYISGRREV